MADVTATCVTLLFSIYYAESLDTGVRLEGIENMYSCPKYILQLNILHQADSISLAPLHQYWECVKRDYLDPVQLSLHVHCPVM